MTDDVNAKVTIDATQAVRALASLDKNVAALRSELQDLGIDVSKVNRNLDNIEAASNRAAKGLSGASNSAKAVNESLVRISETKVSQGLVSDATQIDAAFSRIDKTIAKTTRAQDDLARRRVRVDNSNAAKEWDAEYSALVKATSGARGFADAQQSIVSQRYALYDVANFYKAIGIAAAGAGIYATVVGAQFQAAFSNVQRTMDANSTPEEIESIRRSLINLSSQIPLTFQELSQIATVGNQMGLAGDQVTGFTETIARFSSVAGISIDETSKAFGGFMAQTGLSAQYLENLGSAIAYVSLQSNASEAEILSLTREIAAQAAAAGFTSDQIVGLAGSFARLRVPPERARGSLTTYFETLNKAVAEGGDKLNNFAIITGHTSEELSKMVASGQGATVLRDFLQGIGDTGNTVEATKALEALGLQQLRISDTVRRLSADLNAYDQDQQNANQAFIQGSELSRQYGITVETLASQWQIFINGINALMSAVSGGAIPTLTDLFQVINQVVFALANFIGDNQAIAQMAGFALAVVGVTGALFVLRGAAAAGRASILAFNLIQYQAAAAGVAGANGARAFAGGAITAGNAAGAATGRVLGLGRAMALVGKTTLLGIAITAGGAILGKLAGGLVNTDNSAKNATLSMAQYNQAMADANAKMKSGSDGANNLADQLAGGGPGGGGGVSGAADAAAAKVRLLTDYVSDLTGVFKRTQDLRFGPQAAMDEITLKWINLNEKIDEYKSKIRTLTADKSLREYWLQNALAYDDQIRASQLREEIAKIDDDLANANKGASTELKGNSKAAIENRKTMRDLAGSYDDYIAALAAAGVSQADIQNIIQSLNGDFVNQSAQIGFASNDVQTYAATFADLSKIIAQVPRDITIGFNPDPAQQALDEFFTKMKADAAQAGSDAGSAAGGVGGGGFGGGLDDALNGGGIGDPFGDFWNGEQDKVGPIAELFGTNAGNMWADKLLEAITNLDFSSAWKILQEGWKQTIGSTPFGSWIQDTFNNATSIFEAIGNGFAGNFSDSAKKTLAEQDAVTHYATDANGKAILLGKGLGSTLGQNTGETMYSSLVTADAMKKWTDSQKNVVPIDAAQIGTAAGNAAAANVLGSLNASNPVGNWAAGVNGYYYGWNLGADLGGGIQDAIGRSLTSINLSIGAAMKAASSLGGRGYATGGYTGAGHWLQPAGVVHRGEYVIPKKHVDQRTGLPDVNYVSSLQRAKSAPGPGYANGGFVNAGMTGPFELGPMSLAHIANSMSVKIGIGAKEISNASSRGDRQNARFGSN